MDDQERQFRESIENLRSMNARDREQLRRAREFGDLTARRLESLKEEIKLAKRVGDSTADLEQRARALSAAFQAAQAKMHGLADAAGKAAADLAIQGKQGGGGKGGGKAAAAGRGFNMAMTVAREGMDILGSMQFVKGNTLATDNQKSQASLQGLPGGKTAVEFLRKMGNVDSNTQAALQLNSVQNERESAKIMADTEGRAASLSARGAGSDARAAEAAARRERGYYASAGGTDWARDGGVNHAHNMQAAELRSARDAALGRAGSLGEQADAAKGERLGVERQMAQADKDIAQARKQYEHFRDLGKGEKTQSGYGLMGRNVATKAIDGTANQIASEPEIARHLGRRSDLLGQQNVMGAEAKRLAVRETEALAEKEKALSDARRISVEMTKLEIDTLKQRASVMDGQRQSLGRMSKGDLMSAQMLTQMTKANPQMLEYLDAGSRAKVEALNPESTRKRYEAIGLEREKAGYIEDEELRRTRVSTQAEQAAGRDGASSRGQSSAELRKQASAMQVEANVQIRVDEAALANQLKTVLEGLVKNLGDLLRKEVAVKVDQTTVQKMIGNAVNPGL